MKYFRWTPDYVLWGISFANVSMYVASIPTYKTEDEKKKTKEEEAVDGFEGLEDFFK
jgi:hypothetical protein